MEKPYHVVENKDTQQWSEVLAKNGQTLLPMVELIEQSKLALDELVDRVGRATIEAVLKLSAEQVAGPPHPGKKGGEIGWHGGGQGTVCLKERKLGVKRPRLRKKKGDGEAGEVSIPAYEAMRREEGLGSRMLEILLRGVSTRQYAKVLPEMAETTGVSRSSVSREAIEASEAQLKQLCERCFEDVDLLIVYVDGVIFGEHHVVVAVGVDREGRKHVLGLAEGASENEVVARGLLEDLVRRGVKPDQKYLFVIGVRGEEPRAAMSPPQDRERRRVCIGRTQGSGEGGDAGGVSPAEEGRDGQVGEAGRVVRPGIPGGGRQPARRLGGDVHHK